MSSLLLITGPPGAGKSAVSRAIAHASERSVQVEGDRFFGFFTAAAIESWKSEANEQNDVAIRAAAPWHTGITSVRGHLHRWRCFCAREEIG
jgi:cytidylate kinase